MRSGADNRHAGGMDERLELLPHVYAQFLRLHREGLPDVMIAEQLGVPLESLPLLARLAEAKLARLESAPDDAATPRTDGRSAPPATRPSVS